MLQCFCALFACVVFLHMSCVALVPNSAASLSLKEKIGQLFVVPAAELLDETYFETLKKLIEKEKIGGIILKQGTIEGQKAFIARLQQLSSIPLLCIQDAEYGVAMRLCDAPVFPRNLTLGAVQDLSLLYQLGQEIGRQCNTVGARLNLAPVVDVNSNPLNPIIHMRSFGEDPLQVAGRAKQISLGMQSVGALSCIKHFPGHGDVTVDPHLSLPCVAHTEEEWSRIDLLPFQYLIQSGVDAVLSAHLCAEGLEGSPFQLVPFSREIITDLLRKKLQFNGLVITDALNMQALSQHYSPEKIALGALSAGHDLLLYGDHIAPNIEHILRVEVPCALRAIEEAVAYHQISEEELTEHVERILAVKRKLENTPVEPSSLHFPRVYELTQRLFEEAVTVVGGIRPLIWPSDPCALIEWGESPLFMSTLEQDRVFDRLSIQDPELTQKLSGYSRAILVFSGHTQFDLTQEKRALLQSLADTSIPMIVVVLGTPYVIGLMPFFSTFVIAYENEPEAQRAAAHVLTGVISPKGRLPISIPPYFKIGEGWTW